MNPSYFENYKTSFGKLQNLDEMIDSYDLPMYDDASLYLNNQLIATLNEVNYEMKFVGDIERDLFIKNIKETGYLEYAKKELKVKEVPESLLISGLLYHSLTKAKEIQGIAKDNTIKTGIKGFLQNIMTPKSQSDLQYDKLEAHRLNLKRETISKSVKIK